MSKANRRKKQPNLAPAALLRARLEAAWLAPTAVKPPPEHLAAALQAASQGLILGATTEVALAVFCAACCSY